MQGACVLKWLWQLNECQRNPIKVHQLHKLCLQRKNEQLVVIFLSRSEPPLLEEGRDLKTTSSDWTNIFLSNYTIFWPPEKIPLYLEKVYQNHWIVLQNYLKEFVDWKASCGLMTRGVQALTLFSCFINAKWDKQKKKSICLQWKHVSGNSELKASGLLTTSCCTKLIPLCLQ